MATNSQKMYNRAKEAGLVEKKNYIKFKGTGEHIVKFVGDTPINGTNFRTGQPEIKMRYVFNEGGDEKTYETAVYKILKDESGNVLKDKNGIEQKRLSNFVESMNQYEYGDTLKMVYTPIPGGPRGYVKIDKMNLREGEEDVFEEGFEANPNVKRMIENEEIPVIEEGEPTGAFPEDEDIDVNDIPL